MHCLPAQIPWELPPDDEDLSQATFERLWTLVIDGTERQCLAARYELRERLEQEAH